MPKRSSSSEAALPTPLAFAFRPMPNNNPGSANLAAGCSPGNSRKIPGGLKNRVNMKWAKPSRVYDHLYIGGAIALSSKTIYDNQINFIVNATVEAPTLFLNGVETLKLWVKDTPETDLSAHFDSTADLLHAVHQNGGRALVHCLCGVSRSAALILAYLVKYRRMSLREAYHFLASCRPVVRPSVTFWHQLIEFEQRIRGTTRGSVRFVDVPGTSGQQLPDVYMVTLQEEEEPLSSSEEDETENDDETEADKETSSDTEEIIAEAVPQKKLSASKLHPRRKSSKISIPEEAEDMEGDEDIEENPPQPSINLCQKSAAKTPRQEPYQKSQAMQIGQEKPPKNTPGDQNGLDRPTATLQAQQSDYLEDEKLIPDPENPKQSTPIDQESPHSISPPLIPKQENTKEYRSSSSYENDSGMDTELDDNISLQDFPSQELPGSGSDPKIVPDGIRAHDPADPFERIPLPLPLLLARRQKHASCTSTLYSSSSSLSAGEAGDL